VLVLQVCAAPVGLSSGWLNGSLPFPVTREADREVFSSGVESTSSTGRSHSSNKGRLILVNPMRRPVLNGGELMNDPETGSLGKLPERDLQSGDAPTRSSTLSSSSVQLDLGALTHSGHVRTNNEDHYLVVCIERSLRTLLTNLAEGLVPRSVGG